MNFEKPQQAPDFREKREPSKLDRAKRFLKKSAALAGLGATLLSGESCADEGKEQKALPKGPDPIVQKTTADKIKNRFPNASEVEAREKEADDVAMGYLEVLSHNKSSGNTLERDADGNVFIELYGWFYKLNKQDLLRLRSIVMRTTVPQNASEFVIDTTAQALKTIIDLEISAHAEKVTDPSIFPPKIKAHFDELAKMGLIKEDNRKKGDPKAKTTDQKGKVRVGPDFDGDGSNF